jgi:hypothetical protein
MRDLIMRGLLQASDRFMEMLTAFLPRFITMVIVIAAGTVAAWLLKVVLRRLLLLAKFDTYSERAGAAQMLQKAGFAPPVQILSRLAFWIVWLAFFFLGLIALEIQPLQDGISRLLLFLPQIFVALFILFLGLLAANFLSRAVLLAAVNANIPSPRMISAAVRLVIALLAITMALDQLALGDRAVLIAFSVAIGGLMLGLGLAFGIGGQHVARRLLEKYFLEGEAEKEKELSSL